MTAVHAEPDRDVPTQAPTGATRHLCTGVYVDEKFRDLVINEICPTPYRRVAPSYGFDHVPVMRHAWWATHLHALLRLTMLASVVAPFLLGHTVASALTAGGITLLMLLDLAIALSTTIARTEDPLAPRRRNKKRKPTLRIPPARDLRIMREVRTLKRAGLAALAVGGTMTALALTFPAQAVIAGYAGAAVLGVAVFVGVVSQLRVNRVHRPGVGLRPRRLTKRETVVAEQQKHPCVVYRRPAHQGKEEKEDSPLFTLFGDESPFVGAGELIHQWNPPMGIQLLRPGGDSQPLHEREHRHPPFRTDELVDHLREAVLQLRDDEEDVRLPVDVRDRVFVASSDVSTDRSLIGRVDPLKMRRLINEQSPTHHHFLEVSVPDAGSELVATVLLHATLRGRTLNLFFAACALTRTPDSFRKAEEFGQHGKRAVAWAAFRALRGLPRETTDLWRVVRYPALLIKALFMYRRELTLSPIRNVCIGSRLSIRQERAQEWSKVQLDKTQVLSHVKNVELRLLKATSDFLHSRGVDISEFDDRAMQIINSGIVNLGGTNDISNNNLGDGTQVNNHGPQQGPGTSQNGDQA